MAVNLFGTEADRRERILDLVGHASSYLFPCGLFLRAEQFSGVFEDEHVALMLSSHTVADDRHFEKGDSGEQIHRAAESVVAVAGQLDLARR